MRDEVEKGRRVAVRHESVRAYGALVLGYGERAVGATRGGSILLDEKTTPFASRLRRRPRRRS